MLRRRHSDPLGLSAAAEELGGLDLLAGVSKLYILLWIYLYYMLTPPLENRSYNVLTRSNFLQQLTFYDIQLSTAFAEARGTAFELFRSPSAAVKGT